MGYYNGCGGDGGIEFGKIVRKNLELLPKYKQEKALSFWQGVEINICKPHDLEFYIGGGLIAYTISNWKFAYRFTMKLWWTNLFVQIIAFPILFIGLSIGGVKYFNWCLPWNKRKLGN